MPAWYARTGERRPSSAGSQHPRACQRCVSTPTTMSSPRATRTVGVRRPSRQPRLGTGCFGRGTSDDKGGFAVHLAALRAFDGKPPVGVTVLVEGDEEIGSLSLARLLEEHRAELAADVFVITDSCNWAVGQPAFTTTLRGLAGCTVEVRTLDHALHSGVYGGVVPDALTALCRMLATLHDDEGNVAVAGLATASAPALEYPAERLREESGILDGVDWIGSGSFVERMWYKPAVSVIALDATPVDKASNTLIPVARAKISARIAPGDDAAKALDALVAHLNDHAPWGAQVTVTAVETAEPSVIDFTGPYAEAARAAFTQAWGVRAGLRRARRDRSRWSPTSARHSLRQPS